VLLETLAESPVTPSSELGPYRREDYLQLPDEPRCELIFGRFYVTPSPVSLHQALVFVIGSKLDRIARETGGFVRLAPLDVTLADHSVVQPDIIYITPEHRHILQDRIEGAPDLLVEVLSPGTARRDRGEKLKLYAESGVREYWIVDPAARDFHFLVNVDGRFQVALAVDGVYRSEALPEVVLDLADLWRELDERLP